MRDDLQPAAAVPPPSDNAPAPVRPDLGDVLENMGEAFIILDREFRVVAMNREGERIDGRPRGELLGRHVLDIWPESRDLPAWPMFERAMAERTVASVEYGHQSDRHDVWLEVRCHPIEAGLAVFYRDATVRHAAEDGLRQSEARLRESEEFTRRVLQSSADCIKVLSLDGRMEFMSEGGMCVMEVDDFGAIEGLSWPDFWTGPQRDLAEAALHEAREGRVGHFQGLAPTLKGNMRWWDVSVTAITGADGRPERLLSVSRDITASHLADDSIRIAEERLRLATRATNDAIWDWTFADGRVLWNETLRDAFGHAPLGLETSADWWIEQIHPEDRDRVSHSIHAVIDGDGATWTDEYRFARADGTYADVLDRGTVVRDGAGKAQRMIGAMLDLSGRKRTEVALRTSEHRYRTLFEAIAVGFCVIELKFDADGRPVDYLFIEANPAFARLLGLEGAPGRWMREIAPDHEQYWFDIYGKVATTGEPIQFEQWTEAFGSWLDLYAFRIDGAEPNRVGVLFSDITERKRAEQELRASEDRLRLATQGAQLGTFDFDPNNGRLDWDDRTRALFGLSPGVPVTYDEAFVRALHPDDTEVTQAAVQRALDPAGDGHYEVEYRTIGIEDGIERWVLATGQTYFDEERRPLRLVGVVRDISEAKRTAEALGEKDATIRAFYETSDLYAAVLELEAADFCFVTANAETARFYHVEDLSGGRGSEFMEADLLPRMLGALWTAQKQGRAVTLEYPFRVGRQTRWYLATLAPMPPSGSGKPRISVASFDITDRKRAERGLKASEERLEAITDSVDQMIWSTRPDGYHDYYNRRWYEFTGMAPGSTDGAEWNGMFHPDDQPRAWDLWRHSLETGKPYEIEYRLRHRSGEYRWVIGRARAVFDAEGRIARWYGTCTDIHDLKVAEDALRELNATLEQRVAERTADRDRMWRLSTDLMLVSRFDATITAINPAWTRLFGWSEADLLGTSFLDLVHPEDLEATRTEAGKLAEGVTTLRFENRYRARDGSYRWLSWTAVPDDQLINAVARDIDAEKRAEAELALAQDALRQAQKMEAVGQLTGGIAHDFNNLLTVVMGNIDMGRRALATGADGGARIKRALDNAQRGAERAAALTQRLLAFARRQPLLPKPLDVDRLVAGMSDLLTRALGETVQLEVVTAPGLWRVEADPNQLESAILNLAVNARDAMPGGGKLSIETANANLEDSYSASHAEVAPGQYVVIAISDTGEGISRETLEHVFEPFFTTKEVGKGTGLGLSQVYGFVKQSGGHVKIYSEPGQGTTVKIYLPRMLAGTELEEEPEEAEPELAPARETVLVVEDDDDVRRYSSEVIRELGYRVLEAEDGAAALRVLERDGATVDLLFTDVVMPGLSGRELADRARALRPGLRVLFTSGYTRNAIARNGRLEPGMAMIAKPFGFAALARKIRDALDTGKSGRILLVADAPFPARAALEGAGHTIAFAANAAEALGKVRSGSAMFDAVLVDGSGPADVVERLCRELRALRTDLPILLIADEVGEPLRQALAVDPCGALLPRSTEGEDVARAVVDLGVSCAYAHSGSDNAI